MNEKICFFFGVRLSQVERRAVAQTPSFAQTIERVSRHASEANSRQPSSVSERWQGEGTTVAREDFTACRGTAAAQSVDDRDEKVLVVFP